MVVDKSTTRRRAVVGCTTGRQRTGNTHRLRDPMLSSIQAGRRSSWVIIGLRTAAAAAAALLLREGLLSITAADGITIIIISRSSSCSVAAVQSLLLLFPPRKTRKKIRPSLHLQAVDYRSSTNFFVFLSSYTIYGRKCKDRFSIHITI